jgi:predicted small metal-binding protein
MVKNNVVTPRRQVGVDCDYVGKGDTEVELMNDLTEHFIKEHGYTREDLLNPVMQEKIKDHFDKSNTFINRTKPEQKHVHDPGLKTIMMVENELRENHFFTSKNSLWRSLPKQTQYATFCKVLDYLEESNKIEYDKDGNIVWIFVESKKAQKLLEDSTPLNLSENTRDNAGRLSVSCRDVFGGDCDYVGRSDTEEELVNNLIHHAMKDHGYTREYFFKPNVDDFLKPDMQKEIAHIACDDEKSFKISRVKKPRTKT